MSFLRGDKVTVIDEDLSGTVIKLDGKWVVFECEDGFEYRYPASSLYRIGEDGELYMNPAEFKIPAKDEDLPKAPQGLPAINFKGGKASFDLHLEELLPDARVHPAEALEIQLNYARTVIQKAIQLRVRQLVFIHGVGQGVLRDELRKMLRDNFPNIEFFDGDYQKFGPGATEVIIHGLGSI